MASAMLLDKEQEQALGNMEIGKAIVKLQGRIPESFMIHVPEFKISKGSVSDDMIRKRMTPHIQKTHEPAVELSDLQMKFLKDVERVPDSGMVSRRVRGISCRALLGSPQKLLAMQEPFR